jgi:hypothetical protein
VWTADDRAAERAIEIVGQAVPSLLGWALSAAPADPTSLALWKRAFELTFGAELRAERTNRSAQIVDADRERYERFANGAQTLIDYHGTGGARWWRRKQLKGKLFSIARLAKASATFAGGADYIAWKINRHAGTTIELTPWQRRHPLLAGLTLLPRLLKSGAVR